jgi:flagellar basal-body rod protein FlgF
VIEKPWIDLSQGVVHSTGSPLDVALSGKGFFSVQGPGGPLYTRNGNFSMAPDGKLVTSDGYAVLSAKGAPVTLQPSRPMEISTDGTVTQDGAIIGQLGVVDFTSTADLSKQGNNYFRASDPAVRPTPSSGTTVEQGKLEASNTGSAEGAVRLISIMRQFEMLQKAVSVATEMNKRAFDEVAKVGS